MAAPFHLQSYIVTILIVTGFLTEARYIKRDNAESTYSTVTEPAINPGDAILWDPAKGPKYQDVAQGTNGDCWFDAAIASMAYANPTHLESIFNDPHNSKGTVTINLWDQSTPYSTTVTKWTLDNANSGQNDAPASVSGGQWVWPNTLGDAFQNLAKAHSDTGIATDLNGGYPESAYRAISGPGPAVTNLQTSNTPDDSWWDAWNQVKTRPSTACTVDSSSTDLADGLPSDHCYTAIDCDQGKGTVTLRNPWAVVSQNSFWGTSNNGGKGVTGLGDGVFEISLSDFKLYFSFFTAIEPC